MRAVETHLSWLVFVGGRVFKVKKPAVYDFLDWRTDEARAAACRTEVELNRRLAPDVYEGVGQFRYPDGRVEPVVVMKRLPSGRSLSALVVRADPGLSDCVIAVARLLAAFHQRARRGDDVDANCRPDRLAAMWSRNLAAIDELSPCPIEPARIQLAGRLADRYLQGRGTLVEERIRAGHGVDGHGDLLCDDVFCMDDGPRVLDCLEFDPKLRLADTVADLAFLEMDLEHRGRPDLAGVLAGEYQRLTGDIWPRSWEDYWIAYRATVRAKVGAIRGVAGGDPTAAEEARRLMELALTHLRSAQVRLVLVGGLPGTGKSTLAAAVGARTGWRVLSSDAVRRHDGGSPDSSVPAGYGQGRYAPGEVAANYRALLAAARQHLVRGESVVLDATWTSRERRDEAARLAEGSGAGLLAVQCITPEEVARRRILARPAGGASEATADVAAEMAARWEPWPDALQVDTTDTTEANLRAVSYLWDG